MLKRILIFLAVVAVLAVGGYLGWQYVSQRRAAAASAEQKTDVVMRGNLTALVGATGTVRSNQSASLAWETSGTVGKVLVAEGEAVAKGQLLAEIAADSLPQNVILAQSDLANAQKALDDLLNSDASRLQAQVAISNTQKTVLEAERATVKYDDDKYEDDLDKALDDIADAKDDLKDAQEDFDLYKDRDPDNETRKSYEEKLRDAQHKYDEKVRIYDLLKIEKAVAETNLAIAQANLADAQRHYGRVENGPDAYDQTALEARIAAAKATIDSARLTAPFAGIITHADVLAGDQASPGKVIFRLDDLSHLLVDVRISEVDINRIQVGQKVFLTFDAIQDKEYEGMVSEVSDVGVANQGIVEFAVTIELTNADENVKPGMTAAVNIVVEQLENVLLVPRGAVRVIDGKRVVYVVGSEPPWAEITLGASSDVSIEVVDGLQEGETILLNPPLQFDTNGPPPMMRGR